MHPDLRRLADRQFGVFTAQDARRAGYREDEVRTLVSTGRWSRIRRGVYLDGDRFAAVRGDVRLWHMTQCAAVLVGLGEDQQVDVGDVVAAVRVGVAVIRRLRRGHRRVRAWGEVRGVQVAQTPAEAVELALGAAHKTKA